MDRRETFEAIYMAHKDHLLTIAGALTGDRAAAEDVVHDVFASLLKDGRWMRKGRHSRAFLAVCVRNRAVDLLRSRKRRDRVATEAPQSASTRQAGNPVEQAGQREEAETLLRLVRRLPGELREAVALRTWGGLGFGEIAKAQGTSKSTAHARYSQALERLHAGLTKGNPHE